jgi:gamma-glutamylcyclotransferase (GGCT)/AIG2-like uncharacterized protein YtfP
MLVAVYGSLRKGLSNYKGYLTKSVYLGKFDSEPVFTLKSLTHYPALIRGGKTSVVMEVFRVTENTLNQLNILEGFYEEKDKFNHYNREIIKTPYGDAFVYLYNCEERIKDATVVKSGDWVEFLANAKLYNNA